MSFKDFLKEAGDLVVGISGLKDKVDETVENVQVKVEQTTKKVIKSMTVFIIIILGFIFGLVGLGMFLNNTIPALAHGLGFALIGIIMIILGVLVQALK